jgi:ATP-dependent DNA helicase RecG
MSAPNYELHSLKYLINQGLVTHDKFEVNVAGLLLFGDTPQSLMSTRCGITIARYATREPIQERQHLKAKTTIEGSLYNQINEAADYILNLIKEIKILTSSGQFENVAYPREAIWEILVNAVIHRDYSISDDIQILIFDNRIEITSPGKLPGHITTKNYLETRFSRNSKIVRCLAKYTNPPNKDLGEGLNTAFSKMKEFKLRPPILEELEYSVRVVIPHTPLGAPEDLIIQYLDDNLEITNKIARELTGIGSENKVKEVFKRLNKSELIERVPDKKGPKAAWRRQGK